MPFNDQITRDDLASLIEDEYSSNLIDGAAAQSVVLTQGRRLPDMNSGVRVQPVLETLPTAYFNNAGAAYSDTSFKQTSKAVWQDKKIHAEELSVIVPIPENVIEDANYDIWEQISPHIEQAMGQKIDAAVMFGTDKPNSWPDAVATAAVAAGNTVTQSSGTDLYDEILGADGVFSEVEKDGYNVSGNYAPPALKGQLRGLRGADGNPIFQRAFNGRQDVQSDTNYELAGTPIYFSNNGAFDPAYKLVSGAFDQLVYAIRKDITIKIITEGVITDGAGNIEYNLPQQDMIALRAVMRLGWQVPNPANLVEEDSSARYPFAVLEPEATT